MTLRRVVPPVVGLLLVLGVWELGVAWSGVAPFVLPPPSQVFAAAIETAPVLGGHLLTTMTEAVLGLTFGALAGVLLAVVVAASTVVRLALYPLLAFSQTIPMIVLAPLLIIWAGFGLLPKVIVVMLTVFFPVLVAAVSAAESVPRDLSDMVRGLGGGRREILWLVRIPAALPAALGGLRIAATYTVGAAVIAEYMAGESGLGVFIQRSRKVFAVDQIFVAVGVIGLVTAALFLLIDYLATLATPWNRADPARQENT